MPFVKIYDKPRCHPDLPYYAKGFCRRCYNHTFWGFKNQRNSLQMRKNNLKRRFKLSLEDYDGMVKHQSGKCALCDCETKKLVVDHDHETGRVRGLLCTRCNIALGGYEYLSMNCRLTKYLRYNEAHPRLRDLE